MTVNETKNFKKTIYSPFQITCLFIQNKMAHQFQECKKYT